VTLDPHVIFESLGWVAGYLIYRRQRRAHGDIVSERTRRWVTVSALVGGLVGARLLHLLEDPARTAVLWTDPLFTVGGKTIVGGLIGGVIGVELTKKLLGVRASTGDLLAVPLCMSIAIGRIGCYLAGLADDTYGLPTRVPWGVDFGDGIVRHPTQLYEVVFLLALAAILLARRRQLAAVSGDAFKLFMLGYMSFRFLVDFLKPAAHVSGLSVIQWACLAAIAFYGPHAPRVAKEVAGG
jgi:prolipoprotein diacylglyceryltransferase